MAVSIDEMVSTVEAEPKAKGNEPAAGPAGPELDAESFAIRFGAAVRAIVREELERYLRNMAD